MKTTAKMIFFYSLVLALLFSGCGPGQSPAPTPTPPPTTTPPPTNTPAPTNTALPTPTPTASLTPAPLPEPPTQLGYLISDPSFTFYDAFDSLSSDNWNIGTCQTIANGELVYTCTQSSIFSRKYVFHNGEGILIDLMKVKPAGDFNWGIGMSSDSPGASNVLSFGITDDMNTGTQLSLGQAVNYYDISWLESDVWYRVALAIDPDGRLLVSAWERDKPSVQPLNYSNNLGQDWAKMGWTFYVNNDKSITLHLDNFYQFKFGKVK